METGKVLFFPGEQAEKVLADRDERRDAMRERIDNIAVISTLLATTNDDRARKWLIAELDINHVTLSVLLDEGIG